MTQPTDPAHAAGRGALAGHLIDAIELGAAAVLAAVTGLTFVSVALRYLLSRSIPDSYDLSALGLGILIFWGIGVASYRGEHITVDLVWTALPARARRLLDMFAGLVTLAAMLTLTATLASKVLSTLDDQVLTFDLHFPVGIFYGIAWIGLFASIALMLLRIARLVAGLEQPSVPPINRSD